MGTIDDKRKMRDPAGDEERYADFFSSHERVEAMIGEPEELFWKVNVRSCDFRKQKLLALHLYAAGAPLGELGAAVQKSILRMASSNECVEAHRHALADGSNFSYPLSGDDRDSIEFVALSLTLLEQADELHTLRQLAVDKQPTYFLDLMLKAFIPGFAMAKKYKADKYQAVWIDPVLRALALAPADRPAALAAYMGKWCRTMAPWGWKPKLDLAPRKDNLFWHFAYEVALAVCAYDIDDSSFNTHPYYPRDLVEHYRTNLRHTRDAWRAEHAGAGIPVIAPPLPSKADLAKSKRKGLARWVELVSDGNTDATDAVIATVGKVRKVKDIDKLIGALAEQGLAICADIKDDDTLAIMADRLAEARRLGNFDAPPGPPLGPARCVATLQALGPWLAQRGYRLVALDNDSDAWSAVIVKQDFYDELHELGNDLGIAVADPAELYQI